VVEIVEGELSIPQSERARRSLPSNGAWMLRPQYLAMALRSCWTFRVRRHIRRNGVVWLARGTEVRCRRGLGRLDLGPGVWIGRGTAIRCHEGTLRIGRDVVFGAGVTVNSYLDVRIDDECLLADGVYVGDFDHRFDDPATPIRLQGIEARPVRIGRGCWLGRGAVVTSGVEIGEGSVIGALAVVTGDVPPRSVAVGNPARVVRTRA
jgi:acetyltransferase-like isoleucine patch superfamily enzyme